MATPKTPAPKVPNGKRIDTYTLRLKSGAMPKAYVFLVKALHGDKFVLLCPEFDIREEGTDLNAAKAAVEALAEARGDVTWEAWLEVTCEWEEEHPRKFYREEGDLPSSSLYVTVTEWQVARARNGDARARQKGYDRMLPVPQEEPAHNGSAKAFVPDTPEARAKIRAMQARIKAFGEELAHGIASPPPQLATPDKKTPKRAKKGAS